MGEIQPTNRTGGGPFFCKGYWYGDTHKLGLAGFDLLINRKGGINVNKKHMTLLKTRDRSTNDDCERKTSVVSPSQKNMGTTWAQATNVSKAIGSYPQYFHTWVVYINHRESGCFMIEKKTYTWGYISNHKYGGYTPSYGWDKSSYIIQFCHII